LRRVVPGNGKRCIPSGLFYSSQLSFKGRNKALEVSLISKKCAAIMLIYKKFFLVEFLFIYFLALTRKVRMRWKLL
jgi:hypothetical protein